MKNILMFTVSFLIGLLIGYGVLLGVQSLLRHNGDDRVHTVRKQHTLHTPPITGAKGEDSVDKANKDAQKLIEKFAHALNGKQKQQEKKKVKSKGLNTFIDFISQIIQNLTFIRLLYTAMIGMFALVFATTMGRLVIGTDHTLLRRLSGWATVLPPMFGVAGTMAALATFAGVDPSHLAAAFRTNVGDAVGTTIVGIAFYTLNLFMLTLQGDDDAAAS